MPAYTQLAFRIGHIGIVVCALIGCGRHETLYVRAGDRLNFSPSGEATSIDIRIYQLRRREGFLAADFSDLWLDDVATLADDRLGDPKAVTIRPGDGVGEPRRIDVGPWQEGALYVGIMALYAQPPEEGARRAVLSAFELEDHISLLADRRIEVRDR